MKKLLLALLFLSGAAHAIDVRESACDWSITVVSVSTTTATAIPTTAFSGRYKAEVQNTNVTYKVYIGTHSAMTTSTASYEIGTSTSVQSSMAIPLPSGKSIYGLGEANGASGTLTIRVIEYK